MERETATAYALAAVGAIEGAWKYYVKPELTAGRAWAVLAAGVLAYELAAPEGELMSEGVDRALERSPVARAAVYGAIGCTALHLVNAIPEKLDPFSHLLKFTKGKA